MSIVASAGRSLYKLSYQISPIILVNGLAENITEQMLPIVALTQSVDFATGLLSGSINIDEFLCHFEVIPGGNLISNQVGQYPFANQAVAANAIIAQPLRVALHMKCPVNTDGGHLSKFVTLSALKGALDYHIQLGGTFTVVTPSFIYDNCLLLDLKDVSNSQSKQVQNAWQWEFYRPLIAVSQTETAQSSLISKLTNGDRVISPSWSGLSQSISPTITNTIQGLLK